MRLPLNTFVIFWILFVSSTSVVFSQGKETSGSLKGKGTVFLELFGNGGLYSLNYDRVFYHKKRNAMSWRTGLNYWPYSNDIVKTSQMTFLGEFNYLRGKKRHYFESGIGFSYWRVFRVDQRVDQDRHVNFYLIPRIGYRYQKAEGGFFFRAGVLLLIYLDENVDRKVDLHGGVSLGYTLKFSGRKTGTGRDAECPKP